MTGAEEFDWEALFQRCDKARSLVNTLPDESREKLASIFAEINQVFLADSLKSRNPAVYIGRVYSVLNWLLNPKIFTGEPLSLKNLAEMLDVDYPRLSNLSAEISRRYGIRNCFKTHNWRDRNFIQHAPKIGLRKKEARDEPG
jgi:hypothetical protein